MSSVNEWIVREYLEAQGFLVRQPAKHQVIGRAKRPEEEIGLLAVHPSPAPGGVPESMVWSGTDLRRVRAGLFSVIGWHTERLSPATLELSPDLLSIADARVIKRATELLGGERPACVLFVPALPASAESCRRVLERLREAGIDAVIPFRTLLLELTATLDVNRHYEKSDLLQILRILKVYGLLKGPQLDLFRGHAVRPAARRSGRPRTRPPAEPSADGIIE